MSRILVVAGSWSSIELPFLRLLYNDGIMIGSNTNNAIPLVV
jgi:hypothetical protein